MLRVFVPAYDPPTTDNLRLAQNLFKEGSGVIFGGNATREALHDLIQSDETSGLLLMSHGDDNIVCAQNGSHALTRDDVRNNLGGIWRLAVFAWVCKTSNGLGPLFRSVAMIGAGSWWGYRTTVSAPSPLAAAAFQQVLNYIISGYKSVHNELAGLEFLDGLRNMCEQYRDEALREMAKFSDYRDAQEIVVALRECWLHLDGWLPAHPQPIHGDLLSKTIPNSATTIDGIEL